MDDIKKYFLSVLHKIQGLQCVLVTDREGVPLININNGALPDLAMKTSLVTTFTMAADQSSKLGMGRNKTVICMYSKHNVVQFNKLPTLVITFIGNENCNIGQILSIDSQIDPYLEDIKKIVLAENWS